MSGLSICFTVGSRSGGWAAGAREADDDGADERIAGASDRGEGSPDGGRGSDGRSGGEHGSDGRDSDERGTGERRTDGHAAGARSGRPRTTERAGTADHPSQPWVNAQNRWSEAAELLRTAGRSPVDLREWLGSGWTGAAADGFGAWGEQLQDATRRAAAALTDAAASAAAISTRGSDAAQYLLPQTDLDALDNGVRRISAVLVPGQRATAPGGRRAPTQQQRPGTQRSGAGGGVTFPADRHAKVQGWIDEATDVLHQQGYTDDQINRNAIATIIRYESNGNPSAVNGGDSNAASGNHSRGLMQTIPPTFRHYALPGHTQIMNPVDNIIAGVRYAVDRYGSVSKVPGVMAVAAGHRYVGY